MFVIVKFNIILDLGEFQMFVNINPLWFKVILIYDLSCNFDTPYEWFKLQDWTVQNETIGYYSGTVSYVLMHHDIIISRGKS